mmetsp:Transcript_39019/g.83275  ORF Transcript_39019/g.83275 Transcript_39019/m.83275 type:complete len:207 (+) Transcript_39019:114-734(+)
MSPASTRPLDRPSFSTKTSMVLSSTQRATDYLPSPRNRRSRQRPKKRPRVIPSSPPPRSSHPSSIPSCESPRACPSRRCPRWGRAGPSSNIPGGRGARTAAPRPRARPTSCSCGRTPRPSAPRGSSSSWPAWSPRRRGSGTAPSPPSRRTRRPGSPRTAPRTSSPPRTPPAGAWCARPIRRRGSRSRRACARSSPRRPSWSSTRWS